MINLQLSKRVIHWPVWPDRVTGSGVDPSRSSIFLKLSADKFNFVLNHMKYVVFMGCTIKILISSWPRRLKFSQLLQAGRTDAFHFSHHSQRVDHALRPIFMDKIVQNLIGEFIRKIYAASLYLFTLTAEADRILVSTCNVFNCLFPLDVQNEIPLLSRVLCYSWLVVYWVFG